MKNQRIVRGANRRLSRRNSRRGGYVAILIALSWLGLCGVTALSFDLSRLYSRKAEAQKAADAAALAGAAAYGGAFGDALNNAGNTGDEAAALAKAREYAAFNGYGAAQGATVLGGPGSGDEVGLYRVTLWRPEPLYFARVFVPGGKANVYATAAAEYTQPSNVPLQNYGKSGDAVSLSVFGPNALKEWGDPFSPKYISSDGPHAKTAGTQLPNPEYKAGGYDFSIQPASGVASLANKYLKDGKALMQIEIFDPGSENNGGGDAQNGLRVDEYHNDGWGGTELTTTKYTLRYRGQDIETKSFGPGNQGPDMAWDKTFTVDLTNPRFQDGGEFTLNVQTTDGMSENGFNLRAGPVYSDSLTDAEWVAQYGNDVKMSGKDHLPMNFNKDGLVTIDLGNVPDLKRGGKVYIEKYDVDVVAEGTTSNTVTYYDNGNPKSPQGIIDTSGNANGVWAPTDSYSLNEGYSGGRWTAQYAAGRQDTSLWRMRYTGPGNFRLVR